MSFESDLNQFCAFSKMKDDYRKRLCEKYKGRTFTVLASPHPHSNFKVGESYSIDGFSIYGNETYIINSGDGVNRTIRMCEIRLNPLPSRIINGIIYTHKEGGI